MANKFTVEKIRAGFDRFYRENGRYPTALEVDSYPHLPSARLFQRRLGGLKQFRKELGHKTTDFGRGENRSGIAATVARRGRLSELELENVLVAQFGEAFVHIEKRFGKQGHRVDFYVYSPSGNFGIDVFWATAIHHVRTITSMKMKAYQSYPPSTELYFLCANRDISQKELDAFVANKKYPLSRNIKLISPTTFASIVSLKKPYRSTVA